MSARALLGSLAFVLTGCYETVPLVSGVPRHGSELEVRVTDTGRASLKEIVGDGAITLRGHYNGSSGDSLRLGVLGITRLNGQEDFWKGEPVGLSKTDIAFLSERRISRPKTGAVIALGAAGLALVRIGFEGRTNTTGTRRPPPTGQ